MSCQEPHLDPTAKYRWLFQVGNYLLTYTNGLLAPNATRECLESLAHLMQVLQMTAILAWVTILLFKRNYDAELVSHKFIKFQCCCSPSNWNPEQSFHEVQQIFAFIPWPLPHSYLLFPCILCRIDWYWTFMRLWKFYRKSRTNPTRCAGPFRCYSCYKTYHAPVCTTSFLGRFLLRVRSIQSDGAHVTVTQPKVWSSP